MLLQHLDTGDNVDAMEMTLDPHTQQIHFCKVQQVLKRDNNTELKWFKCVVRMTRARTNDHLSFTQKQTSEKCMV